MSTHPLYPSYLPTRPDGYAPTLNIPHFEADEPGARADPLKQNILKAGASLKNITPRIGTEIRDVQLSQLSPAGLDEVALLAAERGVLVFVCLDSNVCSPVVPNGNTQRDQDFADIGFDKQKDLVRYFGPLHKHPTMGYPAGTGPEFHVVYADETA